MTRFARAKGSKASNERIPEESTPWDQMKNQLLNKQKESEEKGKREEFDRKRKANYDAFINEEKSKKLEKVEWAEIPLTNGAWKKSKLNDDVPEEISSKIQPPSIDIKKPKKPKKSLLKIVVDKESTKEDNKDPPKKQKLNNVKKSKDNGEWNEDIPEIKTKEKKTNKKLKKSNKKINNSSEIEVSTKKSKTEKISTSEDVEKKKKDKEIKSQKASEKRAIQKQVPFDILPEDIQKKIMKKREKKQRQMDLKRLHRKSTKNVSKSVDNSNEENANLSKSSSVEKIFPKTEIPIKKSIKKDKTPEGGKRRKEFNNKVIINGQEVELSLFDGFPVKKEDAEHLRTLKKQLISKGLPRSEINRTLQLERRKAEKALAREKKKVCFNCRKFGHNLSDCPNLDKANELVAQTGTGVCFKCGSTEHTHFECKVVRGAEYKFATCFVCGEQGHISKQCPDNARGLYPKGGACRVCGDVTHLKKDCAKFQAQQQRENFSAETFDGGNPDSLDFSENNYVKTAKKVNKIIKF